MVLRDVYPLLLLQTTFALMIVMLSAETGAGNSAFRSIIVLARF